MTPYPICRQGIRGISAYILHNSQQLLQLGGRDEHICENKVRRGSLSQVASHLLSVAGSNQQGKQIHPGRNMPGAALSYPFGKLLYYTQARQKLLGNNTHYGIGRYSQDHPRYSCQTTGQHNYEEYFEGVGFDAIGINQGL